DAEDAFQATFLVLIRRAGSLDRGGSLAAWLHGVAWRIARRLRANTLKRQAREHLSAPAQPSPDDNDPLTEVACQELCAILTEELHALPVKYRDPLVLCYLQGKTHEQAARELGCPTGSISRHLARGRELLHERLVRRGVGVALGVLGTVLAETTAPAAGPATSVDAIVKAGLRLGAGEVVAGLG